MGNTTTHTQYTTSNTSIQGWIARLQRIRAWLGVGWVDGWCALGRVSGSCAVGFWLSESLRGVFTPARNGRSQYPLDKRIERVASNYTNSVAHHSRAQ
jgi:hypothetical protein